MLRAVLLGLLTLSAVSCKSHDESQAKSQPGIAAGKVIEVVGTVTLHHGTEARPLAKGEMVDADDEVETGADGSVVIEVQHNGVNWELGANKKGKMRDALAWTQPKKDTSAKAAEQDSTAAGRHAERNAAESSANAAPAEMERADDDKKEEAKEETAPAPRPEPAAAPQRSKSAAPPAPAPTTASAPPPPVAQPVAPSAAPGGPSTGSPAPAPPPPPPPPKAIAKTATATKGAPPASRAATLAPSADAKADFGGLGVSGTGEGGGGAADGGGGLGGVGTIGKGAGGGGSSGGTSAPTAQSLVNADKAKLQACLKSGSSMLVRIDVDASGKAKVLFLDKRKWPDETKSCVKTVIDGIAFPKQKSTVKLTIKA